MGKDSSALSLSSLDLSDIPKYVVLKSEFISNLVVFTISDWISSSTSRYSSFNIPGVGPKSTSILSFSSLISEWVLQIFTALSLSCENSLGAYHTACNLMCCLKLTTVPFVLTIGLFLCIVYN